LKKNQYMQSIDVYLPNYHIRYLESICGKPIFLGAKFNLSAFVFSHLGYTEFRGDKPQKVFVPDWVLKDAQGRTFLGEIENKVLSRYIDSLMDIDVFKYLTPYVKNPRLNIKDGIKIYISKHNLTDDDRTYEMIRKRFYRMRKDNETDDSTLKFFGNLSPACPELSLTVPNCP
jgi:hypothetical protein